ncbi:hypothetical protein SAMN05421641_13623 [Paracoccus thiocyanatus]|uniref:Uncharacterized protein n=1 Tax=Paracoccus thiocyanatus TaxID=34006 RepID=A0A1N6ZMU1_9RHOB|nr:hypothetical protein SAMN05421641_13623 [Paracoccus thiocyanatus]
MRLGAGTGLGGAAGRAAAVLAGPPPRRGWPRPAGAAPVPQPATGRSAVGHLAVGHLAAPAIGHPAAGRPAGRPGPAGPGTAAARRLAPDWTPGLARRLALRRCGRQRRPGRPAPGPRCRARPRPAASGGRPCRRPGSRGCSRAAALSLVYLRPLLLHIATPTHQCRMSNVRDRTGQDSMAQSRRTGCAANRPARQFKFVASIQEIESRPMRLALGPPRRLRG